MNAPAVKDAHVETLPAKGDARGALTVIEFGKHVPFVVNRLFFITGAPPGSSRGGHAHYRCSQYMICQSGRLRITLVDGVHERSLELAAGQAILVEPGIFAAQTYLDADSILLVLCDRPYEAEDYIHGMDEFVKYRRGMA